MYLTDFSKDTRIEAIKALIAMVKRFIQQNPMLKKGLKKLTDRSRTRRSGSQKGGGLFDSEHSEEIREIEERIKVLSEQIDDHPQSPANEPRKTLISDYREYIVFLKKWRQFHNYVYVLSAFILAPHFARMLMAFVIHIIAFSVSTVPMAGATTYNLVVAFMGHLFSPVNNLVKKIYEGAGNRYTGSEAPDDSGACPLGTRPDPTLGCVRIFTPEATPKPFSWTQDVTKVGMDTIDAITFNLQHTLADPLQGFATVAVAAAMLLRLHYLMRYEEDEFRRTREQKRASIREYVLKISAQEQTARTAHTASLASMAPAFAQVGNNRALEALAHGIFSTAPRGQQLLLMGAAPQPRAVPPQPIPMAVPRLANAPRGSIVGSPRTHAAALDGLMALGGPPGGPRRRRGSTAGPGP